MYYIKTLILVILANIHSLQEFLVYRDFKGEKPRWLVESAYTPRETGIPEESIHAIDRNRISTRYVGYAQETGVSTI